jgi:hypothetical protein
MLWPNNEEGLNVDKYKIGYGKKDFPEDFDHENGNYHNICCKCNEIFTGHKRRVFCKECQDTK